jgi:hypothetical protein
VSTHLTYAEALIVGAFQGVTELFPVSSLGHSVLVPALIGGRWASDLNVSAPESPYLAFIVGLHVATAAALLAFFWRDWLRIVGGFFSSLRHREIQTPAQRLAWLIVLATIPVGLSGLALEHLFRTTLGRPIPAASFLIINGAVLYAGEVTRRRRALPLPCVQARRGMAPIRRPTPLPTLSTRGSRGCPSRTACSSAAPRSLHCCQESVARASPWSPGYGGACPTKTLHGFPSCWPHPSSWPRAA